MRSAAVCRLTLTFLVLAAVTGLLAFDLLGDVSWEEGRGLFVVLLALAVGSLVADPGRDESAS